MGIDVHGQGQGYGSWGPRVITRQGHSQGYLNHRLDEQQELVELRFSLGIALTNNQQLEHSAWGFVCRLRVWLL